MPVKVNIMLDDDVKAALDRLIERGSWSRVVNEALRKELLLTERRRVSEELDTLRKKTRPVSTREIVRLLRRDRSRGQRSFRS